MADEKKSPAKTQTQTRAALAQTIANATGFGPRYIADQLNHADAWEAAEKLAESQKFESICELWNPQNKAV
jgi:hypothetical protein